jgi:hypothetical protein
VHPRGESKKFNIARGESKEKKLQGGKTKLAHITGGINLFTLKKYYKLLKKSYTHETKNVHKQVYFGLKNKHYKDNKLKSMFKCYVILMEKLNLFTFY